MKKNRFFALVCAFAAAALLLLVTGAYLKYRVLRPLNKYQNKPAVAMPFLYLSDAGMRALVLGGGSTTPPVTTKPVTVSTAPTVTTAPTEGTTVPTTEATTLPPPPTYAVDIEDDGDSVTYRFTGERADDSWFDDALFIGDSRTVGLRDYARSGAADYFCDVGMTIYSVTDKSCSDVDFGEQTLGSLLDSKTYGKIFICLGLNEAGSDFDSLMSTYQDVVEMIEQRQPGASVIVEGLMTVGWGKAQESEAFSIGNIEKINRGLEHLTLGHPHRYFIDCNEVFADGDGYLRSAVSSDGCHLYAKYDDIWQEWIRYKVLSLGL